MAQIAVVTGNSAVTMVFPSGTRNSLPGRIGGVLKPPFRQHPLLVTTAHTAAHDPDKAVGRWKNHCECTSTAGCAPAAQVPKGQVNGGAADWLHWADNDWFQPAWDDPDIAYTGFDVAFIEGSGAGLATTPVVLADAATALNPGDTVAIIGPSRDFWGQYVIPGVDIEVMLAHGLRRRVLYAAGMIFDVDVPPAQVPADAAARRVLEGSLVVRNADFSNHNRVGLAGAEVIGILIAVLNSDPDDPSSKVLWHCQPMSADWPDMC